MTSPWTGYGGDSRQNARARGFTNMRRFGLAAIALLVIPPATTPAATPSWQTATATSVSGAITSSSTFVIQAYVTLPQSCDAARIRTVSINTQLHRSFIVEQLPPSSPCTGKTVYNCTVVSPTFRLPIQQPFNVESKGKTWKTHLAKKPPTPVEPICRKA
jgi:hypothetical protein